MLIFRENCLRIHKNFVSFFEGFSESVKMLKFHKEIKHYQFVSKTEIKWGFVRKYMWFSRERIFLTELKNYEFCKL